MTAFDPSWQALLRPGSIAPLTTQFTKADFRDDRFSVIKAWWMASLCHCAYFDPSVLPSTDRPSLLKKHGFEEILALDSGPVQGFAATSAAHAFLVFRGSDSLDDWRYNTQIQLDEWEGPGRLHRGYGLAFNTLQSELKELQAAQPERTWIITGHSLGAALAILSSKLVSTRNVYAFGCPNMGDEKFNRSFAGSALFRIQNDRDFVTTIPPYGLVMPSVPLGDTYLIKNGRIIKNPEGDENPAGSIDIGLAVARIRSFDEWKYPVQDLSDHSITNYVAALERVANEKPGG